VEKAYAAWRGFQDRFLGPAAALLFVGSTLLALLEVVRRYAFGQSFEWQQDAVTYFILSGVFLYFGISQRRDAHLAVTLMPELLAHFGWSRADVIIRLNLHRRWTECGREGLVAAGREALDRAWPEIVRAALTRAPQEKPR